MSDAQEMDAAAALLSYVGRALVSKAKGTDATSYNNLVKELGSMRKKLEKPKGIEDVATSQLLTNMLTAITGNVSSLRERKHDSLLNEVLGIKIWSCQPIIRMAVMELMVNMILSNASFTHTCLQLLVYSLVPPPAPPVPEPEPEAAWKASEVSLSIQSLVIATLERVAEVVPTSLPKILQLIVQGMPHKLRDRDSQCLFISAMLRLAEAGTLGGIREGLLSSIIDHLLSIDVEIRWEDIADISSGQEGEEGRSEDEDQEEDIFQLEGMSELEISAAGGLEEAVARRRQHLEDRGGWEGLLKRHEGPSCVGGDKVPVASPTTRPPVDEMANKLDSLMELLFDYLTARMSHEASTSSGGGMGGVRGGATWACLLSSFERSILPTQRSKFTQFLIFHASSLAPQPSCTALLGLLLERLVEERQPVVTRVACAAYLASFVARASFLPPRLLVECLARLVDFTCSYSNHYHASTTTTSTALSQQRQSVNGTTGAIGTTAGLPPSWSFPQGQGQTQGPMDPSSSHHQHQVFYASVQATLYILCYHMRALVASDEPGISSATKEALCGKLLPMLFQGTPGLAGGGGGGKGGACLHPLSACLESVVVEFKSQVLCLGIESSSPSDQSPLSALFKSALTPPPDSTNTTTTNRANHRPQRPLEMFFPFDPYLLRRSSKHLRLKETYIRWTHGHPSTIKALRGGGAGGGKRQGLAGGDAVGGSPTSDNLHGGSEEDEDEDEDDDDEDEEGEEGEGGHVMGDSSAYDESSDDELEGMSLPSDSILARPGLFRRNNEGAGGAAAEASRGPAPSHHHHRGGSNHHRGGGGSHTHHRPPKHPRAADGGGGGGGLGGGHAGNPPLYDNVNHDAMMGVSYGTRMTPSSMGESPPTGTSPVLVGYWQGAVGSSVSQERGSPMNLGTPAFSHMDAARHLRH